MRRLWVVFLPCFVFGLAAGVGQAGGNCDDATHHSEVQTCCLGRNAKGLCDRWGEQTCTFDVVCCEGFNGRDCFEQRRRCGECKP